ncbi:hypothetical protein [Leucobacter sp. USHLN153]|uniref:hypothetical protein n=1 Tax=Leucobacter sp. USHLN153 TaxID=3081268 RepID=UPI003015AA2F
MSTPVNGAPLTPDFADVREVAGIDGVGSAIGHRRARAGHLRDAYPSGTHDIELGYSGAPEALAVAEYTAQLLRDDERCRRVVLAVPELDLAGIGWAEDAGYRYVIDVETASGGHSLLVTEPQWVLDQPAILEDIPLKE